MNGSSPLEITLIAGNKPPAKKTNLASEYPSPERAGSPLNRHPDIPAIDALVQADRVRHIDTMNRFAKSRNYLPVILCCIGASLTMSTASILLRYRDASEKYRARVDPIVERLLQPSPSPQEIADRDALLKLFATQLTEKQFKENVGRINRALLANPTPASVEERLDLFSDLHSLRFRMGSSPVLEHADLLIFRGLGLLSLGLFLQKKNEPKPEAPAPPVHAWDSVPPPALAKCEAPTPRP